MILEARAASCFSSEYVLKINDRPIGKSSGRWFSEDVEVQLTQRRCLEFRKIGWFGSQFDLVDFSDGEVVARADRAGMFTSAWEVRLSVGPGLLQCAGWFDTAYVFVQDGDTLARVDRVGLCERGWIIDGGDILKDEDLLMIGLLYQTILQRQRNRHHHMGGHAGT
jgi:hypothetical protein